MRIALLIFFCLASLLTFSQNSLLPEDVSTIKTGFDNSKPADRALLNAVSGNSIIKLATVRSITGKEQHQFSDKVVVKGITDQKSSGRCWMFTGLNTLRPQIIEAHSLQNFEFSTNYLFFWDQLEKANMFLEGIIATAGLPLNDRKVEWLLKEPIGDGGVWNSWANLIVKYGVVPKHVMPETYHSENTAQLNQFLKRKLREQALMLRDECNSGNSEEQLHALKLEMLKEIYRILVLCLGEPPEKFEYGFPDKNGKVKEMVEYTPLSFFQKNFKEFDLTNFVMLMNDPTREFYKLYEIESDKNVVEGISWRYINLPADEIKKFAILSIKDNTPMYASCDVGKFRNNDDGTLDLNNYDFESLLGVPFSMSKKERIESYDSGSSHAMLLIAVYINRDGNPIKWQFENSWGASSGYNGYLSFTDAWFSEYLFRLVVNKKYVGNDVLEVLKQEPIILPPWDPMFSQDE